MKVTLIGSTVANFGNMFYASGGTWSPEDADLSGSGIDDMHEFAGRSCYQSFDKPNPSTRSNKDYLRNIIGLDHESVVSHGAATFYCTGVSRSLTHELIRHRWLSFSELSQRYVPAEDLQAVIPPALSGWEVADAKEAFNAAMEAYRDLVESLEDRGVTGKKAREAARALLPNATETRIVVSGNIRAWRDFLKQRLSPHADAEIRLFATEIHKQLVEIAPNSMIGINTKEIAA